MRNWPPASITTDKLGSYPNPMMLHLVSSPLRKAAERSVDSVCQRIGELLDGFTTAECANYLKNAGYALT